MGGPGVIPPRGEVAVGGGGGGKETVLNEQRQRLMRAFGKSRQETVECGVNLEPGAWRYCRGQAAENRGSSLCLCLPISLNPRRFPCEADV